LQSLLLRKGDFEFARHLILSKYLVNELVEIGPVFKDAIDTWCLISIIRKSPPNEQSKILHKRISRYIISIDDRLAALESNNWNNYSYVNQFNWLQAKRNIIGYLATEPEQIIINKLSTHKKIGNNDNLLISRGGYSGQADPPFRSKVTPMGMAVISSRQ